MRVRDVPRWCVAGLTMSSGLAMAAAADGPVLTALARLEPGEWQIKAITADPVVRRVCMPDTAGLIQYGHPGTKCQRFVITNETDTASVQYTCPGTGHGRTTVKVATPRSFNLETQGILNGRPFEEHYDARYVGACQPKAARAH